MAGLLIVAAASLPIARAQTSQAEGNQSQLGTITPYLGIPIVEMEIAGVPADDAAHLLAATPLKLGEPLSRQGLHDAMQSLFATGRFSDIQAEAEHTSTGVRLRFLTVANYFIGQVTIIGATNNPSPSQLATSSRLQLGELYTAERVEKAKVNLQRILEENGFFTAKLSISEQRNEEHRQVDLTFRVDLGARAEVGKVQLEGDPNVTQREIENISKLHPRDGVASSRLTRALQSIRSSYAKQDRLLAQVTAVRTYRSETNTVDYLFRVEKGPIVEIATEGFSIRQSQLRRLVPIYEEGAVDDDLLNEGLRNIQNHLQTLGYFAATVTVNQRRVEDGSGLRVVYAINPGDRHKLALIRIQGNVFFEAEQIRGVLQEQAAGSLFSHGRYSTALLAADVRNIEDLYRSNGYRQAEVSSRLIEDYRGDKTQLAVELEVQEGLQTLVGSVNVQGNLIIPSEQLMELAGLSTSEGQGFDESSLVDDRDRLLGVYFKNGFTNATVDVTYAPSTSPDDHPRVAVTFSVHEGEQFFVNQNFLSGVHYTRPGVARREFRMKPAEPLSQQDMLETQRHLYDLGLFNEVDTAIQNPDGTESRKNVLIAVREAKRYTFDYGIGFEFQTGQPSAGTNQPLGTTGASPRVSFGMTRINFGGRNQTLNLKANLSRLQQRGLISYEAPKLMNRELRFSARILYDNTVDVSTFTSQRLEGTIQTVQVLKRDRADTRDLTSIAYRFSYRRVQASDIQVTDNLIPLLSKPTRVGEPNFLYIRNRRDNDLETTHGNYTTVEGGVASGYFGSEADFGRFLVKNATYHPFARNRRTGIGFVVARSTSIGIQKPFGDTVLIDPGDSVPAGKNLIPLPERFFMGGGNSHRGFGLNQAGPRDPFTGFPLGGSALFLNNLELRFPTFTLPYLHDNIGFTLFHDMGNVFSRPQDMTRSLGRWHQSDPELCKDERTHLQCNYNYVSHAIGLGVRYQTPIGPLRLDFGYNLNPPYFPSYTNIINNSNGPPTGQFGFQQAGHFNFSFSIGQSF